ncbi:winged helix-turn-helix domain-containing protein [Humidisolicoccus flavus]|uniref:winged helix-turn-helix domain-containing protein n=1 Tax=Humidisolicoccus flavus TaxID=3111414 RepID=UPI0032441112
MTESNAAGAARTTGNERSTLRSTDAATLRALAHPLRIKILNIIDDSGEITATEIAERTGQTVANCSFHLRTLAKHGYIERAPQQGTAKPWRAVHRGRELSPDPMNPDSVRGAGALAKMMVHEESERVMAFLDHQLVREGLRPDWIKAVTVSTASFWATFEEIEALREDLIALTERFAGRIEDPSLRPEGATFARMFATLNPEDLPRERPNPDSRSAVSTAIAEPSPAQERRDDND